MPDRQARPARRRAPSAGLPSSGPTTAEDRIAELESRLARLERSSRLRDRSRDLMGRVMPPESSIHFRNAGREHLLGVRSMVDFWIRRLDAAEPAAEEPIGGRERIEID
jgi:hypothetical protein